MTEEEWLDGLRHLPDDQILASHFGLQDQIKKFCKLRSQGDNLARAIHACEQQIALAPLTMAVMKKNPAMYDNGVFFAPSHHGYRQLSTILKRQKDFDRLAKLEEKREQEGWAK